MATDAALARFNARIAIHSTGCWLWSGPLHNEGYGRFYVDARDVLAHRWSYEHFKGPIPADLTIDHLCHNSDLECNGGRNCRHRRCVNPEHLEAVTNAVNVLRGKGLNAVRARATECHRNHPLSGSNLRITPSGNRRCRACESINRELNRERCRDATRRYRRKQSEVNRV